MSKWKWGQKAVEAAGKIPQGVGQALSVVTGASPKQMAMNPAMGATGLFWGGVVGKEAVVDPIRGAMAGPERMMWEVEKERELKKELALQQVQMEGLRKAMLMSLARLASANPQLYNEVVAGRQLPEGAVVLGGQKRTDLLEELALNMAEGTFNQSNPEGDLLSLIGA